MKHYLLILATLLLTVGSCSTKDDPTEVVIPKVEFPDFSGEEVPKVEGVEFENTPEGVQAAFEPEAKKAEIPFETNAAWKILVSETKADGSWISVNPMSGGAGKVKISIDLTPNSSEDDRTIYVKIVVGEKEFIISIIQKGKGKEPGPDPKPEPESSLSLSLSQKEVSNAAGSFALSVTANKAWTTSGVPNWLTLSPASGDGDKDVSLSYTANTGADARTATVTFKAGEKTKSFVLTQKAKEPDPSDTSGEGEDGTGGAL